MARTQAPDIAGPEQLAVPSAVTDLYAPPPRPVQDNSMGDLANALSSFNTDLRRFAHTTAKAQPNIAERIASENWAATHSNEQVKQAVHDGTLPAYADPVANDTIAKNYANRLGADMKQSFASQIAGGQIDLLDPKTNIDGMVTQSAQQAAQQLAGVNPRSLPAATALAGHVQELRSSLIAEQEKQRTAVNLADRTGVVTDQFNNFITQADATGRQADGWVPQEAASAAHANVRAAYGELGKSLDLPPSYMDKTLLATLKANAKDHPEIVYNILTEQRKDEKGNPLPALAANPRYAPEVKELLNTLTPALGAKWDAKMKYDATANGLDSFNRQDGSYYGIHDFAYPNPFTQKQQIISADEQKKGVMAQYQTWSDQTAASRKERPDQTFDREFAAYENSNQPNPRWKGTLEGISTALSSTSALSNPQAREQLKSAGELYLGMAAKNYNYVKNTLSLSGNAQNYYNVYEVARRYMGLNADQATDTAAAAVNQREDQSDLAVQAAQRKEIASAIQSDYGKGMLSWLTGSGAGNLGAAQKRLTDVASVLVRVNGVDPATAVTNAEKLLKAHSVIVNGQVIPDNGFMPPSDVQGYVPKALQQFFEQHGTENQVSSPSELSFKPSSDPGKFVITKDAGGFQAPTYAKDAQGRVVPGVFSMGDLLKLKSIDAAAAKTATDQKIISNQSSAASDAVLYGNRSRMTPDQQHQQDQLRQQNAPRSNFKFDFFNNSDAQQREQLRQQRAEESKKQLGVIPEALHFLWDKVKNAPLTY